MPEIRDGRLYGRGAQDMKGGVAAMIGAVRRIVESGGLAQGRVIVAAVVDEEHASIGAEALVASGALTRQSSPSRQISTSRWRTKAFSGLRSRRAVARRMAAGRSKGVMRFCGWDASSRRLEALDRRLQQGPAHPLLGTASLHASLIEGGHELSSYPARAALQFERRTLPGEPSDVRPLEADAILAELRREDPEFEAEARLVFGRDAYEIDAGQSAAGAVDRRRERRRDAAHRSPA